MAAFSEAVLEHFRNPRHSGDLDNATHRVEVTNPVCGDVLQLAARVEDGQIREARFLCRGCATAIACASWLTERISGSSLDDERGADQWMIKQAKKNAVSLRRERTNRGLDRGNLATLPISVDHDFVFRERHSRGDGVRIRSEYHATNADSRMFGNVQQVLKE